MIRRTVVAETAATAAAQEEGTRKASKSSLSKSSADSSEGGAVHEDMVASKAETPTPDEASAKPKKQPPAPILCGKCQHEKGLWGEMPKVLPPTPESRRLLKNILVLDGGGLKGIFTLVILKKIEELAECPIRDLFDLMVGCSTGGIIALGSGLLGKSCAEGIKTIPPRPS